MRTRRLARLFFVGALAAMALSTAACAALFGFEPLSADVTDALAPEGSTEAGDTAPSIEAGSKCGELGLPRRPGPAETDGGDPEPIHMALKLFDFGINDKAKPPGFNLDLVCSPTVDKGSCRTTQNQTTFEKYARDHGTDGVDNAGYGLITYLTYLGSAFRPAEINKRLADGEFGFVTRVANWNGTPEDDDVLVEIFPAIGVALDADAALPVGGGKPTFAAGDHWLRDSRFRTVGDASRIRSARAYVTGGKLVAPFESATLPMSVPDDQKPLDIILQEAFLYGELVKEGASWRLANGVLAGRWRSADVLAQIRTIYIKDTTITPTVSLKNVYVCDPKLPFDVYGLVKAEACAGRDLRASSSEDNQRKPCEAVSVGILFDSYAVDTPGTFADLPDGGARCQKDGSVPEGDDCAPAAP